MRPCSHRQGYSTASACPKWPHVQPSRRHEQQCSPRRPQAQPCRHHVHERQCSPRRPPCLFPACAGCFLWSCGSASSTGPFVPACFQAHRHPCRPPCTKSGKTSGAERLVSMFLCRCESCSQPARFAVKGTCRPAQRTAEADERSEGQPQVAPWRKPRESAEAAVCPTTPGQCCSVSSPRQ